MTQPPMRITRRWLGLVVVVFAAIAVIGFSLMMRPGGPPWRTPALKLRKTSPAPGDFSAPRYSPSEVVSDDDLYRSLKIEGFADGIGVAEGVPITATQLPIAVDEKGPNGPYTAKVQFNGKELTIPIDVLDAPGPPMLRAVSDGERLAVFVACCGSGSALVFDGAGKGIAGIFVGGHAHTKGCMAPRRGLLFATRFEVDQSNIKEKKAESEVLVLDMKSDKELGFLRMPGSQFDSLAVSKDEKWLYVGFGDGTVRRFSLDHLFPPPEKKKGWFGW